MSVKEADRLLKMLADAGPLKKGAKKNKLTGGSYLGGSYIGGSLDTEYESDSEDLVDVADHESLKSKKTDFGKKRHNRREFSKKVEKLISRVNNELSDGYYSRYLGAGKDYDDDDDAYDSDELVDVSGSGYGFKSGVRKNQNENYQKWDPQSGLTWIETAAQGYDPQDMARDARTGVSAWPLGSKGGNMVAGNMVAGCGCSGGARKKRSDAGQKRGPNEWHLLVKAVAKHEGLSYSAAMSKASQYKADGYSYKDF